MLRYVELSFFADSELGSSWTRLLWGSETRSGMQAGDRSRTLVDLARKVERRLTNRRQLIEIAHKNNIYAVKVLISTREDPVDVPIKASILCGAQSSTSHQ
jgi:hypothetical protein